MTALLRRCVITIMAVCVGLSLWAAFGQDDEGDEPIWVSPADDWVAQRDRAESAFRRRLESELNARVDELQAEYKLDALQRQRLQLAGRGDITRHFSRIEVLGSLRDQLERNEVARARDEDEYRLIQKAADTLQQRLNSDFFEGYSLLNKTMNTISPKFAVRFAADQKRLREERYENYLAPSLANLMEVLDLRADQKEKFQRLIRTEIPPPARIGQYVYTYVIYQLSRLPKEKLSQVLDEAQMVKFGPIKANAPRYEQSLRNYGLLPGEADEERQEDSP